MKDKKTLKIASIIVAVLIAIVCITKILAAGTVFEDGEGWISTEWGYYIATEEGEVKYAKEAVITDTYLNEVEIKNELENNGFYYKTKDTSAKNSEYYNPFVFCVFQGQQLPSEGDENPTETITPEKATYELSSDEKKALEPTPSIQFEKAVEGRYNEFIGASYKTREFKRDENGKIMGKVTKYATPNAIEKDGKKVMKFLGDGSEEDVTGAVPMSWAEAYVFANNDPNENQERTPAQLALWALAGVPIPEGLEGDRLNEGDPGSCDNEIYEKAVAFESYKAEREERGDVVKLVNPEQDYKYKFNVQGNYLIAGPVQIDYGDLKYGDAELEVMQIENFTVWGKLADKEELEDITEYVEFTDADGNPLSDMNTTSGTEDGEGAGKSFPASKKDFYIKVNYDAPIYTKVVAINSLEVSFKELDVRAMGCKISEVKVCEVQWEGSNVVWQKCKETHNFTKKEWNQYKNYNPYKTFLGYDRYGNPQYQGGYDGGYDYVQDSTTRTNSNHLKENCNANKTCTMGHTNCRVTITHENITSRPSFGVLLRGKPVDAGNAQNLFLLQKAEMYWRRYKLVVLFGPDNDNPPSGMTPPPVTQPPYTPTPSTETPPPDITHRTYIDIGGNVWVDAEETKEGTGTNGKYDEGTNDYPRKNVKVTLKYSDNDKLVDVKDLPDWVQKIWNEKKLENPTYTDEDGNYMFYQLPMDKKYYVEFTYDGMTYTTVDFLKGGTVSDYKANPNEDVYKTNSKAEEDEEERDKFNERFEEILGEGPSSYSGEKTTGKTGKGDKLVYRTKKFDKNLQSRLLTTTEEDDVIKLWSDNTSERETGIARPGKEEDKGKYTGENYEMTVSTRDKELIYPFGEKEYIIWEAENKKDQLEYLKHINLGLKRRPTADLNLAVDIKAGGTAIKDKTKLVTFKSNVKEEDLKIKDGNTEEAKQFNKAIDGKVKELTANKVVTQQIAGTDYYWHKNFEDIYDLTEDQDTSIGFSIIRDELNVYVLYKIMIANQSETKDINATVTGLVDYYSKELTLPTADDQAKIEKIFEPYGIVKGSHSWTVAGEGEQSKAITWSKPTEDHGYNKIEADDLEFKIGGSGDVKSIYLILKVAKDSTDKCLVKDTDMKNITEIKSYKIHDEKGDALGLVDCDSAPYNAKPGDDSTYEDDTDDAPVFKLELNWHPKEIEGNVWDVVDKTQVKDVKVDLVEYIYDKDNDTVYEKIRPGLEIVEGTTVGVKKSSSNDSSDIRTGQESSWDPGYYKFVVEGGNYAIRFTYGDKTMLLSNKKYNGQDYQASTDYKSLSKIYTGEWNHAVATTEDLKAWLKGQKLIKVDLEATIEDILNGKDITQQKWENDNFKDTTERTKFDSSNARDLAKFRQEIIESSIKLTNENSTLLHRLGDDKPLTDEERETLSGNDGTKTPNYTYMESISDIVIVESNDLANNYPKVINLALQERPKMSIDLEKKVSKIVVKTNDDRELINTADASKLNNLQDLTSEGVVEKFQETFINMDTKSMEGATIDIDYTLTVKNTSTEGDKLSNYLYLTGENARSTPTSEEYIVDKGEDFSNLITTLNRYFDGAITIDSELPIKANEIYDYVNINLEFRADDNKDGAGNVLWEKIYDNEKDEAGITADKQMLKENVTEDVINQLSKDKRKVTKVIKTTVNAENKIKNLYTYKENIEDSIATIPVHLGITLAEDIEEDNRTDEFDAFAYSNCAEIIQVYSGAGRRDYDVIPGNYVPYDEDNIEPDSSLTGTSVVTPPLGENRIYYVITIISATIIIAGIVLIKKKVLKK